MVNDHISRYPIYRCQDIRSLSQYHIRDLKIFSIYDPGSLLC